MILDPRKVYDKHLYINSTFKYEQFRDLFCKDVFNKQLSSRGNIRSAYIKF